MDLEILEIASNTENNKLVINHTHSSRHKNAMCGDIMQVSLITCTNNSEKTIKDCCLSIFSQTYENIEHIILDKNLM